MLSSHLSPVENETFSVHFGQQSEFTLSDPKGDVRLLTSNDSKVDFYQLKKKADPDIDMRTVPFSFKDSVKPNEYTALTISIMSYREDVAYIHFEYKLSDVANVYLFTDREFDDFLTSHSDSKALFAEKNSTEVIHRFNDTNDMRDDVLLVLFNPNSYDVEGNVSGVFHTRAHKMEPKYLLDSCSGKNCKFDGVKGSTIIADYEGPLRNITVTVSTEVNFTPYILGAVLPFVGLICIVSIFCIIFCCGRGCCCRKSEEKTTQPTTTTAPLLG